MELILEQAILLTRKKWQLIHAYINKTPAKQLPMIENFDYIDLGWIEDKAIYDTEYKKFVNNCPLCEHALSLYIRNGELIWEYACKYCFVTFLIGYKCVDENNPYCDLLTCKNKEKLLSAISKIINIKTPFHIRKEYKKKFNYT